jgi:hypothetical protein
VNRRPPNVCGFVFVCPLRDWQIQAAPRARSDMGGYVPTIQAIAEAHRAHLFTEHTASERGELSALMVQMGAPEEIARRQAEGQAAGGLVGVELPLWWVDR